MLELDRQLEIAALRARSGDLLDPAALGADETVREVEDGDRAEVNRPDLPQTLQIGRMAYSFEPNAGMRVGFADFILESSLEPERPTILASQRYSKPLNRMGPWACPQLFVNF